MAYFLLHLLFICLLTSASEIPQETVNGDTERLTGDKVRDGGNLERLEGEKEIAEGKTAILGSEVSPSPSYSAQNTTFPSTFPPEPGKDGLKKEGRERRLANHTKEEEKENGDIEEKLTENMKTEALQSPYWSAQNTSFPPPTFPPGLERDGGKKEEEERRSANHTKEEEEVEEKGEEKNKTLENLNTTEASKPPHWSSTPVKPSKTKKFYFCGTPDVEEAMRGDSNSPTNHTRKRRYLLQGKKWDKTELTWALRKSSRHTSRLDSGTIRQQFTTALQLWEKVSALKFTEVQKEAKNIDIYVDFMKGTHGDGYSFDGKGRKLAHAFYPGGGIGGDVHFDDDDHFVQHHLREDGKTSLLITAAHELGHSLGLSHSDAPKALMAPFYQDFGDEFELPQDDRYAIQVLYGASEEATRSPIPTHAPMTTPRPTTTTTRPPRPRPRPTTSTQPPRPRPRPTTTTRPPRPRPRPPTPSTRPPRPPRPRPTTSTTTIPPPTEVICPPSKAPNPNEPDICFSDIDAATDYRGELFLFKGEHYWRMDGKGWPYWREYPEKIARRFPPVQKVDAAYVNTQGHLILFQGRQFFRLGFRLQIESRGQLSDLKINATHLNAAMLWGHNGRAYVFSENKYWRLNKYGVADIDYPRDIGVWRGVPQNISAAFTLGYKTFFLSGPMYWSFDNAAMRAQELPLLTAVHWLSCPEYTYEKLIKCYSGQECLSLSKSPLFLLFLLWFVLNVN